MYIYVFHRKITEGITPVINAVGTLNTVTISRLVAEDIVNVYSAVAEDGKTPLGAAIGTAIGVAATGVTGMPQTSMATVIFPQLGVAKGNI